MNSDKIEAVAKEIHTLCEWVAKATYMADIEDLRDESSMWLTWETVVRLSGGQSPVAKRYRRIAAAALAATDQFGIDAMLDDVHPQCGIDLLRHEYDDVWFAEIRWPSLRAVTGTGPTRVAAIADACDKAKEQKEAADE